MNSIIKVIWCSFLKKDKSKGKSEKTKCSKMKIIKLVWKGKFVHEQNAEVEQTISTKLEMVENVVEAKKVKYVAKTKKVTNYCW